MVHWKVPLCFLVTILIEASLSFSVPHRTTNAPIMNGAKQPMLFPEHLLEFDTYNGVVVDLDEFEGDFEKTLEHQLKLWKQESKRGIWLHVPSHKGSSGMVESACKMGFTFHSVKNNTLILTTWLDDGPSRLPNGPIYQIGVGCLLFHPHDEPGPHRRMLVVKEKTGPAAAYDLWKMPTGLVDEQENIHDACLRELEEETGISNATFLGIVNVRQAHRRSVSDLFFVCQVQMDQLQEFSMCQLEIADIQWMNTSDFLIQSRWQQSPLYSYLNTFIGHAARDQAPLWQETTLPVGLDMPTQNTVFAPVPPSTL